jgi:hypothetical protein
VENRLDNSNEDRIQDLYYLPTHNDPVPPAQGSLLKAWVELTIHPTLRGFAAWGRKASQYWVIFSFIFGFILFETGKLFLDFHLLSLTNSANRPIYLKLLATHWGVTIVILLDILFFLAIISVFLGIVVRNMPSALGSMRKRLHQVLRPLSLSLVGVGIINLAWNLIIVILNTTIVSNIGLFLGFIASLYQLLLILQAISVGAHRKRIEALIMMILAGILLIPLYILMAFLE